MSHPTTMKVRPRKNSDGEYLQIFDQDNGDYLPPEGRIVPRSPFWIRRKNDGDVELVGSAAASQNPEPEAAPAPAKEGKK